MKAIQTHVPLAFLLCAILTLPAASFADSGPAAAGELGLFQSRKWTKLRFIRPDTLIKIVPAHNCPLPHAEWLRENWYSSGGTSFPAGPSRFYEWIRRGLENGGLDNLIDRCTDFETWWDNQGGGSSVTTGDVHRIIGWWNTHHEHDPKMAAHDHRGCRHVIGACWEWLTHPARGMPKRIPPISGPPDPCSDCIAATGSWYYCYPDPCN